MKRIGLSGRTISRRRFLSATAVAGAGTCVGSILHAPFIRTARADPLPGGTLNPATLPKYVTDLFVPPVMPQIPVRAGAPSAQHRAPTAMPSRRAQ